MSKFCSNCGTALRPQAKFCTGCGLKIAGPAVNPVTDFKAGDLPPEEPVTPKNVAAMAADKDGQRDEIVAVLPEVAALSTAVANRQEVKQGDAGRKIKFLMVSVLVLFLVGGGVWYVLEKNADHAAQSFEFDPVTYKDQFVSETEEVATVSGTARLRNYPTTKLTSVISTLQPGETITGRWVAGADPSTHWLRVNLDGDRVGYVWEGNLRLPEEAPGSWRYISTYDDYDAVMADELVGKIIAATLGNGADQSSYQLMDSKKVIEHRDGVDKNMVMVASSCSQFDCENVNWSIWLSFGNKYSMICLSQNGKSEYFRRGSVVLTRMGRCPRIGSEYSEDAINIR